MVSFPVKFYVTCARSSFMLMHSMYVNVLFANSVQFADHLSQLVVYMISFSFLITYHSWLFL